MCIYRLWSLLACVVYGISCREHFFCLRGAKSIPNNLIASGIMWLRADAVRFSVQTDNYTAAFECIRVAPWLVDTALSAVCGMAPIWLRHCVCGCERRSLSFFAELLRMIRNSNHLLPFQVNCQVLCYYGLFCVYVCVCMSCMWPHLHIMYIVY